jgi:hypothetical protein
VAHPVLDTCAHGVHISDKGDCLGHCGGGASGVTAGATDSNLGRGVRRGSNTGGLSGGGFVGNSLGRHLVERRGTNRWGAGCGAGVAPPMDSVEVVPSIAVVAGAWGDAEEPADGGLGAGVLPLLPGLPGVASMPPGSREPACTSLDPPGEEE